MFSEIWKTIHRFCIKLIYFLFYLPFGGFDQFYLTCSEFGLIQQHDRILELCCGAGELTVKLAAYQVSDDVVGVDIDSAELKNAALYLENLPAVFIMADATSLPFQSGIYTKCFVSLGLHHLTARARRKTLREIYRVLTQDGLLFVIDYNLPKNHIQKYLALALVKSDQSSEAYGMVKNDSVIGETGDAGFSLVGKKEIGWRTIQLLKFKKSV